MDVVSQAIDVISKGGVLALCIFILWAGAKGVWVFGWQYKKIVQERDEWREIAQRGLKAADKAVTIASKDRK